MKKKEGRRKCRGRHCRPAGSETDSEGQWSFLLLTNFRARLSRRILCVIQGTRSETWASSVPLEEGCVVVECPPIPRFWFDASCLFLNMGSYHSQKERKKKRREERGERREERERREKREEERREKREREKRREKREERREKREERREKREERREKEKR